MAKFDKGCKGTQCLGMLLIGLGIILVITLIPVWVWWLAIGGVLICFGCAWIRK